jgi:hypothetical protein
VARKKEATVDEAWAHLFARLREARASIVEVTARDTDIEPRYLEPAFDQVLDLVAEPRPTPKQLAGWREEGVRLARSGAAPERVLDGYLSLNWAIWEVVMAQGGTAREVVLGFADRLLRGLDDAIAAISEGYVKVEVELAAAHSRERRAVLEELLTAPRVTAQDRARIRRRAERHGLAPQETYRLVLIHVSSLDDEAVEDAVERLEKRIRVPASHHRTRPGIRLPVVLDWRGRVLVFAKGEWAGEPRLRQALPAVCGEDYIAVDTGPIEGCEALADALSETDYSASVAASLGRFGWIGEPGHLALETTFLLDDQLVRRAVDQELGALLADPRMGEELIETLEVFLSSRQNIREAARRLHLAPRTVAYRLERIKVLLGHDLDGEIAMRLSAALLALRVSRQAGRAS